MINKILYSTDFSEAAENALPHALTLSLLFNAKLILFNAQILHQDIKAPSKEYPYKEILVCLDFSPISFCIVVKG